MESSSQSARERQTHNFELDNGTALWDFTSTKGPASPRLSTVKHGESCRRFVGVLRDLLGVSPKVTQ